MNSDKTFERDITAKLIEWKNSPFRKPLILKGARQVGKTYALKEFGKKYYDNVAYFNLENIASGIPGEYNEFFEATRDPTRILSNLSLASAQSINTETTLIIFDEIQDCPAAIGALKAFCEQAPQYHIACAGSLLEVELARNNAFPVGKVDFLDLHPMNFSEYLRATENSNLDEFCKKIKPCEKIPSLIDNKLKEQLQRYFICGGMPESVKKWVYTSNTDEVDKTLANLLDSYQRDFAKHGGAKQFAKINLIWQSLPAQLARENKKFVYGLLKQGARAREYENGIIWLTNAGLIIPCICASKPFVPLSAYESSNAFKLYCLDLGLLRMHSRLNASAFSHISNCFKEFKGAFVENFAFQELTNQFDSPLHYWTNEKPKHEIDFIVQSGLSILPIEVKSGENTKSLSLNYYKKKYADQTQLRVRLSMNNLSLDGDILNIPLYLAGETSRLIESCLE